MKTLILVVLALMVYSGSSRASDPCNLKGQKNPMGMSMQVSSVTVTDTANFMVTSVKKLPFTMGATDTVWFDVCPRVHDGKMHQTQIKYMTNMGAKTYNVSVMAPLATCQSVMMQNPHPMDINVSSVWVDDSADFFVSTPQPLPFTVKNGAMIDFTLCLTAADGMPHKGTISFNTNMGTFSTKSVTMTAPVAAVVSGAGVAPLMIEAFPNPCNTQIAARISGSATEGQLVLYSASGERMLGVAYSNVEKTEIPVGSIHSGAYFLRLESNGQTNAITAVSIRH